MYVMAAVFGAGGSIALDNHEVMNSKGRTNGDPAIGSSMITVLLIGWPTVFSSSFSIDISYQGYSVVVYDKVEICKSLDFDLIKNE